MASGGGSSSNGNIPKEIWGLIMQKLPHYALIRLSLCSWYFLKLARHLMTAQIPANVTSLSASASYFRGFELMTTLDTSHHFSAATYLYIPIFGVSFLISFSQLRYLRLSSIRRLDLLSCLTNLEQLQFDEDLFGSYVSLTSFQRLSSLQVNCERDLIGLSPLPPTVRAIEGIHISAETVRYITHLTALEHISTDMGRHSTPQSFLRSLEIQFPKLLSLSFGVPHPVTIPDTPVVPSSLRLTNLVCRIYRFYSVTAWLVARLPTLRRLRSAIGTHDWTEFAYATSLRELDLHNTINPTVLFPMSVTYLDATRVPAEYLLSLTNLEYLSVSYQPSLTVLASHSKLKTFQCFMDREELATIDFLIFSRLTTLHELALLLQGVTLEKALRDYSSLRKLLKQLPRLEIFRWESATYVPGEYAHLLVDSKNTNS